MSHLSRLLLTCCALAVCAGAANAQTWSAGPSLPMPIKNTSPVVVGDDAYLFGGRTTANEVRGEIHRFAAPTGFWTVDGLMPEPRDGHAVEFIGGRFYVAGGFTPDWTNSCLVFDPAIPSWTPIAPMPSPNNHMGHCSDGVHLYLFGGGHTGAPRDSAFRYDPVTNQWVVLANMPHARKSCTAVYLGGKVYVMGGHTAISGILDATAFVDVYDIATDTWSSAPELPKALTIGGSAVVNGRIYVMGGADGNPGFGKLDVVFSYRPGALAWRIEPSMPVAVASLGVVAIGDSLVYALGGETDAGVTDIVSRFAIHEPDVVSVTDVPNDQGGRVSLRWLASNLDRGPTNPVEVYRIWQQVPAGVALKALASGARIAGDDPATESTSRRVFRTTSEGADLYYWEFVGSQVANGFPAYSYTVPTLFDSVTGSNPWTIYMVEAMNTVTGLQALSAPDSGYSVDNLAPPAPGPVAFQFAQDVVKLSWLPSAAPDLAGYRVYRDVDPAFEPSPGTLVAFVYDTSYASSTKGLRYYRVAGVDAHGNEGPATMAFANVLAVGDSPSAGLSLAAPTPNPAMGTTRIRYSLAREGEVRLAVYDVSGRECRVLSSGVQRAGEHDVVFDLADEQGMRLGAGLYFVRLDADGRSVPTRLAIIR